MIKNLSVRLLALLAISMVVGLGQLFAQSTVTGGIVGKVTDPQGAVVPNATIIVTNLGTNNAVTVNATDDGTFGLVSFRGISGVLNNSQVDGGDNNQAWQSEERGRTRIGYVVSQSAIREFQVNTSNYSAEYGRSAGGVINTVTKSGTNEFHGSAFLFDRNNKWGARNPNSFISTFDNGVVGKAALKPKDVRYQFGGAVGGPIVKDKAFFFFSYDQQKRDFPGVAVFSAANYLTTVNRSTPTARG